MTARLIPAVGRPVIDAEGEGDRFAGAFATPQGNWLATSDARLLAIFRRLNDRAWAQRWKRDVPARVIQLNREVEDGSPARAGTINDTREV